jgi:O-acetyl-ADP-ribose deacetylase (regulator of RNase III)
MAVVVSLRIIKGDATDPQAAGRKIIAHVCNDLGGWGQGVRSGDLPALAGTRTPVPVLASRARRQRLRARRRPARSGPPRHLGGEHDRPARHATRKQGPPIRYKAVEQCLDTLAEHAKRLGASVHMPRIGCGLAGGKWERIEPIIVRALCERDVPTTVYDFD